MRPNAVDIVVDGAVQARIDVHDLTWAFHPIAPLHLSLDGANDAIVQLVGRAPAAVQATDPRPLTIAVKNLSLRRADGVECEVRR